MKTGMYDVVFAEKMILERCESLGTEWIPTVNAAGRILACDINQEDIPKNDGNADSYAGRIIAKKGSMIRPVLHGMLIGLGIHQVEVYRKPLIGFYYLDQIDISSNEDDIQKKSNRYILGNVLKEFGFSTIYQGCIPEEKPQIVSMMRMASAVFDAIFICAGSEPEDFERVQHIVELIGAEVIVDHMEMQPGKTSCTGFIGQVPVFGIAGTAEELLSAFYLIVLPALKKIAGRNEEANDKIMVELGKDFEEHNEITRILPGQLFLADGIVRIQLKESCVEPNMDAAQEADAYVVIPAGKGPLKKGTLLNAFRITN